MHSEKKPDLGQTILVIESIFFFARSPEAPTTVILRVASSFWGSEKWKVSSFDRMSKGSSDGKAAEPTPINTKDL